MDTVISVRDLTKKYGDLIAVDNISFEIKRGEIFGLLGPNGAGKTTTVEMIEGLRKPDNGYIKVCGIDISDGINEIKEMIGVQLQTTTIYDKIRVREVIDLFGSYYRKRLPVDNILDIVGLKDKENSFVESLSGGQKKRLAVGLALVNDPEILILDEPTTGLDPQARRNLWNIIERMKGERKTIILTTHYMEEAERFCHRVGIIDYGKIIAMDTPHALIAKQNLDSAVEFTTSDEIDKQLLEGITGVNEVTQEENKFILYAKDFHQVLIELTRISDRRKFNLENITVRKATLEDVFLELTGRRLRE